MTTDYYLSLPYSILLKPSPDPEDGCLAIVLELPGCFTAGDTKEEALALLEEAMHLWLEASLAHGHPIPEPQPLDNLQAGLSFIHP
jgi:predicted RNase H-like HicB family nuclease